MLSKCLQKIYFVTFNERFPQTFSKHNFVGWVSLSLIGYLYLMFEVAGSTCNRTCWFVLSLA
jgi:hypothetical protein